MHKSTLLSFAVGLIVGAGIGYVVDNMAIGMGLGAALGLIFARRRNRWRDNYRR